MPLLRPGRHPAEHRNELGHNIIHVDQAQLRDRIIDLDGQIVGDVMAEDWQVL